MGEMAFGDFKKGITIQIGRVSDGWVNECQRAHLPESFAVADPIRALSFCCC